MPTGATIGVLYRLQPASIVVWCLEQMAGSKLAPAKACPCEGGGRGPALTWWGECGSVNLCASWYQISK